jgi:hypothetical protein
MQRLHPLLLMQQPAHSFEDLHPDNGGTRNELLSDQVLASVKSRTSRWAVQHKQKCGHSMSTQAGHTNGLGMLSQVLSVADAAAHGIAAAVVMSISAGIRRRCQALAAAISSRGRKVLPPCAPDAQLVAALPAIVTMVKAQVHLHMSLHRLNPCMEHSPGNMLSVKPVSGHASCRSFLPKRPAAHWHQTLCRKPADGVTSRRTAPGKRRMRW